MSVTSLPRKPGATERVAEEVRALMARKHVTQNDLSQVLRVSQTGVSKRLSGKTPFDANEIGELADYFGVHPAALFGQGPGGGTDPSTLVRSYHIPRAA